MMPRRFIEHFRKIFICLVYCERTTQIGYSEEPVSTVKGSETSIDTNDDSIISSRSVTKDLAFEEIGNVLTVMRGRNFYLWERILTLKSDHPDLKLLLAVGGWTQASTSFSPMTSTQQNRAIFINSAVDLLKSYSFDGLDIDWEYPALRGGNADDKANLVELLREMKPEFDKNNLIITIAIGAGADTVDTSYDLANIHKYVDHISAMTYDFYVCGGTAPIEHQAYLQPREGMSNSNYCTAKSMEYMESKGVPNNKLVMGLPLYGRVYGVSNNNAQFGDIPSGSCPAFEYTRQAGMAAYYEICPLLDSDVTSNYDSNLEVPYAVGSGMFIGYDDPRSLKAKVKYAMDKGYKGVMVWSLDFDDFNGICGSPYPLLNAIKEEIGQGSGTVYTTIEEGAQPPSTQVTEPDGNSESIITTTESDTNLPPITTHKPQGNIF
ncbi:hypothetical protein GJ496_001723 [Pomphorhynchus laevis]|nr:hypothetical protein GJ496_001723 [Pomphorhynchus laevis]